MTATPYDGCHIGHPEVVMTSDSHAAGMYMHTVNAAGMYMYTVNAAKWELMRCMQINW